MVRTSTRLGCACLRTLRTASDSTLWASGSSDLRDVGGGTGLKAEMCRSGLESDRRLSSASKVVRVARERASERALDRLAQLAERRLDLAGAARSHLLGQVAGAVERHRDPEQSLDHALVHLAREVDPLAQLARGLGLGGDVARDRRERGRLPERPQQVPLGGDRAAARSRLRSATITPTARPAATIGPQTIRAGSGSRNAVLGRDLAAEVARGLDHLSSLQRPCRDRRRVDRDSSRRRSSAMSTPCAPAARTWRLSGS